MMQDLKYTQESLLSIVVPVYKVERYLDRCIESLVNQTYSNIEIILVDDGSPDQCPALCDKWAEKDARIRVIHKENGGLSDARNAGIAAASGEYIAFVDSDDYIALSMYETMISAMQRTGANIACCGRKIVKGDSVFPMHCMDQETEFTGAEAIREMLLGGYVEEAAWDKVYRRNLFDGIRFPKGENNEDIVVMPQLLDKGKSVIHVGLPLYYYCQNGESITRSAYSPKKRIMLKHLDEIQQYLEKEHQDLLPYFAVLQARYCQSVLYLLLDHQNVLQNYRQDYLEFYKRFRETFFTRVSIGNMNKSEKLKGYLIYYRLYYFLHKLKKAGHR